MLAEVQPYDPLSYREDPDLVDRVNSGDLGALEPMLSRALPLVYPIARRRAGEDGEDLLHQAAANIFEKLAAGRLKLDAERGNLAILLLHSMGFEEKRQREKTGRETDLNERITAAEEVEAAPEPAAPVSSMGRYRWKLRAAIEMLEGRPREIMRLRARGLSVAAVARALGVSEATARRDEESVRGKLREIAARDWGPCVRVEPFPYEHVRGILSDSALLLLDLVFVHRLSAAEIAIITGSKETSLSKSVMNLRKHISRMVAPLDPAPAGHVALLDRLPKYHRDLYRACRVELRPIAEVAVELRRSPSCVAQTVRWLSGHLDRVLAIDQKLQALEKDREGVFQLIAQKSLKRWSRKAYKGGKSADLFAFARTLPQPFTLADLEPFAVSIGVPLGSGKPGDYRLNRIRRIFQDYRASGLVVRVTSATAGRRSTWRITPEGFQFQLKGDAHGQ